MRVEFPVTRPFPRLWSILLIVFAVCSLLVLFIVNVPLAGYNLVQFTTRNWDFEQDMWWDPFIPSALRSKARKCQPTKISTGTRFRLDNDLFDWTIQKLMTRDVDPPLQRNNTGYGVVTGWKTVRANQTLEYKNQPLDVCDLYGVFWKADLRDYSIKMFGDILCDLPIPFIARTTYSAGADPMNFQSILDGTYYDLEVLVDTPEAPTAIPFASNITTVLQYLGYGFVSEMVYMFQLANGSYPAKVAGYLVNPDWCPVSLFGKDSGCKNDSSSQPTYHWGPEFLVFDNLTQMSLGANSDQANYIFDPSENTTYSPTIIFSEQIKPATFNLMNAFVSAIRTDLGGRRANNMFQSREALSAQLYRNQYEELLAPEGYFTAEDIKNNLLNDPSSQIPIRDTYREPTRIVINYLCTRQELKKGAMLVFNVSVAAFALFGTVWTITMLLASLLLQQRKDWKGASGACLAHSRVTPLDPRDSAYINQQYLGAPSLTPAYSTVKEQTPFFS